MSSPFQGEIERAALSWSTKSINSLMADIKVEYHKTLCPKIWDGMEMKPEVRKGLLAIVNTFIDFCGVPIDTKDIRLVGSMANYTWTAKSDIDINIYVDMADFKKANKDLLENFFETKKKLFKRDHDIRIYGIPMEMTICDLDSKAGSDGEYSIKDNKWVTQPEYQIPDFDEDKVAGIADRWRKKIVDLVRDPKASYQQLDKLKDSIKDKRAEICAKGDSEFDETNLAYKHIRKNGYMDAIRQKMRKALVKDLSVK